MLLKDGMKHGKKKELKLSIKETSLTVNYSFIDYEF